MRPKKKPAKATQKTIWAGPTSAAPAASNAPGWNSTRHHRRDQHGGAEQYGEGQPVTDQHLGIAPGEQPPLPQDARRVPVVRTYRGPSVGRTGVSVGWRQAANRSAHTRGVSSPASRSVDVGEVVDAEIPPRLRRRTSEGQMTIPGQEDHLVTPVDGRRLVGGEDDRDPLAG